MMTSGSMTTRAGTFGLTSWLKDSRVKIAVQVLLIAMFSCLAAAGKQWAPSLGIPGSSGIFWLPPLILGRILVKRNGAGTVMGAGMAGWGMLMGFDKASSTNLALYGSTGLILDVLAALPFINIGSIFGAIACGFGAHMVKYCFVVFSAFGVGTSRHFMAVGLLNSAGLHAGIGIASAVLAWAAFKGGEKGLSLVRRKSG